MCLRKNIVRHRIDDMANSAGQFILTGSSTPPKDEARHSGAGRIGRVRMRTMTMTETEESNKSVSLAGLFQGEFEPQKSNMGLEDIARIICRGGWPALQNKNRCVDSKYVIEDYLDVLFDISLRKAGKNSTTARRIAKSLARNLGTSATLKTIANDAAMGKQRALTEETISNYLTEFSMNYFLDELHGWDAPVKAKSRVRTKPKRYFDDPSLGAALLSLNPNRLLEEGQVFGVLFESLCIHDLWVYASLLPEASARPLYYYSDSDGLDVDVIIELRDGRWAAIEIKLGESKVDEAAKNLQRLRAKITANPAARNSEPEFMAILVGKGEYARQRKEDGIYVIPIDTLTV
ncbi:ATP-binding protein [Adlercreutzia sp. ZJ154]|uniref:ATP-binding protein n=1 Tax=Adlercreutzia sp. ZJ154 TaxID=2709790 RepID=UPI0013EB1BC3|nr:DUF4143 domain-containing protein [Adlercreutzia sp. ZJ154]